MRLDRVRLAQISHREHFDQALDGADQARVLQRLSVDGGALHTGQVSHVDNLENLSLTGREAALWNAALQRHLPALEAGPHRATTARFLTVLTASSGLAFSGTGTSTLTLGSLMRAGSRT